MVPLSGGYWCLPPPYPDGIGKVTYNYDTGNFVFRGHVLLAGEWYGLYSTGDEAGTGVAVGNGVGGAGNNVLIKGTIDCSLIGGGDGGRWNLFIMNTNTNNDDFK